MELKDIDFSVLDALQEVLNSFEEVEYAGVNLTHPRVRWCQLDASASRDTKIHSEDT